MIGGINNGGKMKKILTLTVLLFTVMSFAPIEIKANEYALPTKDWQYTCSRVDM